MWRIMLIAIMFSTAIEVGISRGAVKIVREVRTKKEKIFSRGLSVVHREQANHQCSAVVISQRFALTSSTCLDGAGNLLSVDIFQPGDHA
eukprot:evm.model.scf_2222.3 EVM.evm.TU.scf_2222.3   scf_2222:9208-11619(-)